MKTVRQSCCCSSVHLAALMILLPLFAGCKHTRERSTYAELRAASSIQPAASIAPAEKLRAVELPKKLDPAWFQPPGDLFTLGPGDRLDLEIIGDPASKTTTVVGPDGKIYFSLLAGVDVWGATLSQAKAMLENELSKYVREKP